MMAAVIPQRNADEIAALKRSGVLAAKILQEVVALTQPGVTTRELDRVAQERIQSHGAKSAFREYAKFPGALCCSVNAVAVHGAPNDTPLKDGDLLGLDFGVVLDGWYSDVAVTIAVGNVGPIEQKLLRVTREALGKGIAQAKVGNNVGDVSVAIQTHVESAGFEVIRELAGHGVGRTLHEPPQVPNYGKPGTGPKLISGIVIAIEPITAVSTKHARLSKDGLSYETNDGSITAHFEHTVAVTKDGPQILTLL